MLESDPLRLGETCKGNALTVDLCVGWAECLEYGQRVKKTGIFLRIPPSYDAGAFCLGPCEKRQCDGKPVIRSSTIPREREPRLPCTTRSGGASRIGRWGYAIVVDRSRLGQADRRSGDSVVREGTRNPAQGDSVWLR